MTDLQRDRRANDKLTQLLRQKCSEQSLRVMRIRWGLFDVSVEVELQLDLPGGSFRKLGTLVVFLDPQLGFSRPMSCLEDKVVDAVAQAFDCDKLRQLLR
jgi:hypothetical protein